MAKKGKHNGGGKPYKPPKPKGWRKRHKRHAERLAREGFGAVELDAVTDVIKPASSAEKRAYTPKEWKALSVEKRLRLLGEAAGLVVEKH